MSETRSAWGRAVLAAVAAEVGQVAATFAWVAFYSYVIAPGQPVAAYEAHAQRAGPWVSIVAGAPIFFAAALLIARTHRTAMAMMLVFVVMDGALLAVSAATGAAVPWLLAAASYATKWVAASIGGRLAERRTARSAA